MISDEWPAMQRGEISPTGTQIMQRMWKTASDSRSLRPSEQATLEQS